jgi:hypothetical protein
MTHPIHPLQLGEHHGAEGRQRQDRCQLRTHLRSADREVIVVARQQHMGGAGESVCAALDADSPCL